MRQDYHRNLRVMTDQDLERFVKDWLGRKSSSYRDVQRFGGANDLGRDVVGYRSDSRMSGPWDNYQCKQLLDAIDLASGARELGKIFWHSSRGEYGMPERYAFVAPSGIKRDLEAMIAKPVAFKAAMLANWNKWCGKGIAAPGVDTSLSDVIRTLVTGWDFARVTSFDAHAIVDDPDVTAVLVDWFGYDPGKAPRGVVPDDFQPEETDFSDHLLEVYRQNAGIPFADLKAVLTHARHGSHLGRQRRWFFDAASFRRFYRDNTPASYLVSFDQDMHDGIIDVYERVHADRLERLNTVMSHAGTVKPSGILGHHSEVGVRQGTCHHFVNEGRLSWKA